jgi:iron only hydrogenase large subunit-like protein
MEGAILKTYYAKKMGIDPKDIFVVSIMPCTVKKFESGRVELSEDHMQDVDAVLTTRELVRMFKTAGIDFSNLPEEEFDHPMGESTGAAAIFGSSGGVMEAALRTAYFKISGKELDNLDLQDVRGNSGIKECTVPIKGLDVNVAVVNGIGNVGKILDEIEKGESKYHFIEVMSCPGGCINGGGQPIHHQPGKLNKRIDALYEIDAKMKHRRSHENESLMKLYKEFLGEPNSHIAHELLHTTYTDRKKMLMGQ